MNLSKAFHGIWRWLVFLVGDLHLLHKFPGFSFDDTEPQIRYEEIIEGLKLIQPGDVGLHRQWGYGSNLAIPGFMKHAWIHINAGEVEKLQIIEAVSEGVLKQHAIYPMLSKYIIILRPKGVTPEEIKRAIEKANKIVGCQYDIDFKFDIEQELQHFHEPANRQLAKDELNEHIKALQGWDGGFSCTETVSFAWWHKRQQLGIHRVKARGKQVILSDNFINNSWEIIWLSKAVTPETAKKYGLSKIGINMIVDYWSKREIKK